MKTSILMALLIALFSCHAQQPEFGTSANGLIYADTTVAQLKHIVDSLNIKFRTCDLSKTYYCKQQARAHFIRIDSARVREALSDLEADMPFEAFVAKYPEAKIEKDLIVIRYQYTNYDKKKITVFESLELGRKYAHELRFIEKPAMFTQKVNGKWIIEHTERSEYYKEYFEAFFFTEELNIKPLPLKYQRMIQYANCMVDTTTGIFTEKAEQGDGMSFRESKAVKTFMDYVHQVTHYPEYDSKNYKRFQKKRTEWEAARFQVIDTLRSTSHKFDKMLEEAIHDAEKKGTSTDELEEYIGRYYSLDKALELKRSRIVVGMCSMDQAPRYHALNIAMLSAATVNWEVFLRAHLDIMNDNFQRASDGSYAWKGRKTYIRELEVLDINVLDLLLGISLRIENPAEHHYYGSISRLGRALAETQQAAAIEAKMLEMITDNALDDYNRILIYYLFRNYNYALNDENKQKENEKVLKAAVEQMPEYIRSKILAQK